MKFFCSLILLFIVISPLHAIGLNSDQVRSATLTISKINSGLLVDSPKLDCSMDVVGAEILNISNLYNQCAIDLCKSPSSNKTAWSLDENFTSNISLWKKLKLKLKNDLFEKVFDTALKDKKLELAAIKDKIKNPEEFYASLKGNAQLSQKIFMPHLKVIPRGDLPLNERVEITINIPKDATPEFIQALNDYAAELKMAATSNPYILGTDFYTTDEKVLQAQNALAAIKSEVRKNPKALSAEYLVYLNRVDQYFKEPDQLPIIFTIQMKTLIDLMNELEKSSKKDVIGLGACTTISCKNSITNYLKNNFTNNESLKENVETYERLLEDPQTKKHAINRCKASIAVRETKEADAKAASRSFADAKKSIIDNILPKFSEHSRGLMLDYLNNKLTYSAIRPGFLIAGSSSRDSIDVFKDLSKVYLQDPLRLKLKLENDAIFRSMERLKDDFESLDPLDEVYPCGSNRPNNLWDSFLPMDLLDKNAKDQISPIIGDKDHVFVSDFSCKNHDHGTLFTAHELSHAISSLFRTAKLSESSALTFSKVRSCVKENNVDAPVSMKMGSHDGDKIYTEEDFADFMAIQANLSDKKIYNCALLKPSLVKDTYSELSFTDKSGEDPHSTGIVRVIQEATLKDVAIPQSCQDLISKVKPKVSFNKCSF